MSGNLAEIQSYLAGYFWYGAAIFLRVSAMVSVLPAFGERTVPVRIKLVLSVMFTLIVAPSVPVRSGAMTVADILGAVAPEVLIGVVLGLAIRLFVLALQTAGSIAAQSTTLAQILGGAAAEPMPAMGYVLVIGGLALAAMSGLHVQAARFMIESYEWFPFGQFPAAAALSEWGVGRVANAFSLAFVLSAPFVIASVIYNLALGVINRAMPQLMVAFVGAPVITFGGLAILFLAAPMILLTWNHALFDFFQNPTGRPK